ncbi:hypothetical protein ES703_51204 [subsurface metagenome]
MEKESPILIWLGFFGVLTTNQPPLFSPAVASSLVSKVSSRTITISGFSICEKTLTGLGESLVEAVIGAPRRSAPKEGAAVTPLKPS